MIKQVDGLIRHRFFYLIDDDDAEWLLLRLEPETQRLDGFEEGGAAFALVSSAMFASRL